MCLECERTADLFLRTLKSSPRIGQLVRKIFCTGFSITDAATGLRHQLAKVGGIAARREVEAMLQRTYAAIISRCPNLTGLLLRSFDIPSLSPSYRAPPALVDSFDLAAATLTELCLWWIPQTRRDLNLLLPSMPALERATLVWSHSYTAMHATRLPELPAGGYPKLRHLDLVACFTDETSLCDFLSKVAPSRTLKRLELASVHAAVNEEIDNQTPLAWKTCSEPNIWLGQVPQISETIQRLKLDAMLPLDSSRQLRMSALVRLEIGLGCFPTDNAGVRPGMLPHSLREVLLYRDTEQIGPVTTKFGPWKFGLLAWEIIRCTQLQQAAPHVEPLGNLTHIFLRDLLRPEDIQIGRIETWNIIAAVMSGYGRAHNVEVTVELDLDRTERWEREQQERADERSITRRLGLTVSRPARAVGKLWRGMRKRGT